MLFRDAAQIQPRQLRGDAGLCLRLLLPGLPVALVLPGTGFARPTRLFIGWFGPRGLASVVFGLIATEQLPANSDVKSVTGAIALTVLLSVVRRGVSAGIGAQRYGSWATRTQPSAELTGNPPEPLRLR